jgi:ketosteroid isomerase-like protein
MIKAVVLFSRRSDVSPEALSKRWLEHGELVRKHAKALRMRRYVQNHKLSSDALAPFTGLRGWPTSKFDGMVEVWHDSLEDIEAAFASPEGQAANRELAADEAEFIDQSSVQVFLTVEHVLVDEVGMDKTSRRQEFETCARNFDRALETGDFDAVYTDDLVSWHNFTNVTKTKAESIALVTGFFAGFKQKGYSQPRYTQVRRTYTDKGFIQQHVVEAKRGDDLFQMPAAMVVEIRDGRISKQDEYLDPSPYMRLMEQA